MKAIVDFIVSVISSLFGTWLSEKNKEAAIKKAALSEAFLLEEKKNTETLQQIKNIEKQEMDDDAIDRALTRKKDRK